MGTFVEIITAAAQDRILDAVDFTLWDPMSLFVGGNGLRVVIAAERLRSLCRHDDHYVPVTGDPLTSLIRAQVVAKKLRADSRTRVLVLGDASVIHSFLPVAGSVSILHIDKYIGGGTYFRMPSDQFSRAKIEKRWRDSDGTALRLERYSRK